MDKLFWNVYYLVIGIMMDGVIYLSTTSNMINFKRADYGGWRFKNKTYLLGDASYASWYYLLRNFKPVDGNLEKIMFDQQMNVGRVSIENAFGILKNRWRILHCINACVDRAPGILMACSVFHNYCQLKDHHHSQEVFKKIHFVVQGGKCFFFMKVKSRHNMEKQCILHFSQIGWLSTPTPFDVFYDHFGNIGALDLRFYYIAQKFGTQVHNKF